MKSTIRAQLVAVQDGIYKNYVFKNLDEDERSKNRYLMITQCPNWQYHDNITIGQKGFLEYEIAEAGENYYNKNSNESQQYRYTAFYFMNFIKEEKKKDNTKSFKF